MMMMISEIISILYEVAFNQTSIESSPAFGFLRRCTWATIWKYQRQGLVPANYKFLICLIAQEILTPAATYLHRLVNNEPGIKSLSTAISMSRKLNQGPYSPKSSKHSSTRPESRPSLIGQSKWTNQIQQ